MWLLGWDMQVAQLHRVGAACIGKAWGVVLLAAVVVVLLVSALPSRAITTLVRGAASASWALKYAGVVDIATVRIRCVTWHSCSRQGSAVCIDRSRLWPCWLGSLMGSWLHVQLQLE